MHTEPLQTQSGRNRGDGTVLSLHEMASLQLRRCKARKQYLELLHLPRNPTYRAEIGDFCRSLKDLLKKTLLTIESQTEENARLNGVIFNLQETNSDLTAQNLAQSQDIQKHEAETRKAKDDGKKLLLEIIQLKNQQSEQQPAADAAQDNSKREHSGIVSPDGATNTMTYSDVIDADVEANDWKHVKPLPKTISSAKTVIVGSSICKSLSPRRLSESVGHKCTIDSVSGATVSTIAERIPTVLQQAESAETIVICIGGNDVGERSTGAIVTDYEDLLEPFRGSRVKPLVCSILPRAQPSSFNSKLRELNQALRQMCRRRGVKLLDASASFPVSECCEFLGDDGVHLSASGVKRLASVISSSIRGRRPSPPYIPSNRRTPTYRENSHPHAAAMAPPTWPPNPFLQSPLHPPFWASDMCRLPMPFYPEQYQHYSWDPYQQRRYGSPM